MSKILWKDTKHFLAFPITFTHYTVFGKKVTGREVTSWEKLQVKSGILNTTYEEILLYRITDCRCTQNVIQRLCHTGTVEVISTDKTLPVCALKNIKSPLKVKNFLSDLAIKSRQEKGVPEFISSH